MSHDEAKNKVPGSMGPQAVVHSPARGGRMHPRPEALYYHIAHTALQKARSETDEFERKQAVVTAIIFSALCLEAFINQEYAAHPETRKIIENDRSLSLELKWLLLPLLLEAKVTFVKEARPFQTFHELIGMRNERLVHFKPLKETHKSPPGRKKPYEPYFGDLINDVARSESYVGCVGDIIRKLNELTSGKVSVPPFLSDSQYLSEISAWTQTSYESR